MSLLDLNSSAYHTLCSAKYSFGLGSTCLIYRNSQHCTNDQIIVNIGKWSKSSTGIVVIGRLGVALLVNLSVKLTYGDVIIPHAQPLVMSEIRLKQMSVEEWKLTMSILLN